MFQQMGFGLAVAVLVDATLVRTILVPATMKLLGRPELLPAEPPRLAPEARRRGRRRPAGLTLRSDGAAALRRGPVVLHDRSRRAILRLARRASGSLGPGPTAAARRRTTRGSLGKEAAMNMPAIVSPQEWEAARASLLV